VTLKDAVKKPTPENVMYPAGLKSLDDEAKRLAEEAAAAAAAEEAAAAKAAAEAEQAALEASEKEIAEDANTVDETNAVEGGDKNEG
jgi:large subunit ribosomal protein L3